MIVKKIFLLLCALFCVTSCADFSKLVVSDLHINKVGSVEFSLGEVESTADVIVTVGNPSAAITISQLKADIKNNKGDNVLHLELADDEIITIAKRAVSEIEATFNINAPNALSLLSLGLNSLGGGLQAKDYVVDYSAKIKSGLLSKTFIQQSIPLEDLLKEQTK